MDLEARWKAFQEAARRRGLRIYPGLPPKEAASWDGELDGGEAFLDLARELGVRLVYAVARVFEPEEWLAELEDELKAELEAEPEIKPEIELEIEPEIELEMELEIELKAELEAELKGLLQDLREEFRAEAERYAGRLESFTAVWSFEGILHGYQEEAPWVKALQEREEAILERAREQKEAILERARERKEALLERARKQKEVAKAEERAILEEAARRLAEDPAFQEARTQGARRRLAWRRLPDLAARWPEEDPRWDDLVREALVLYETEIRPQQEQALVERARRILKAGASLTQAAARLGISRQRLERLLARYGGEEE